MIEIAEALTRTLKTFVTLHPHQLAGNAANLDFWVDEVIHSLSVIDGLKWRMQRLNMANETHLKTHGAILPEYDGYFDDWVWRKTHSSGQPTRKIVTDSELKAARREVVDTAYAFFRRCFKERLIDIATFRSLTAKVGTSVDPADVALEDRTSG